MPHSSWHWPAAGKSLATPVFDNRPSGPGRRWCCRWWWAGWAGASGGWRGRRAGQVAYARWAQGGKRSLAVRSWCCPLHHQATRGNQSAPARSTPLPSSGRAQSEEGCGAWDRPSHSPDEGKQTHRSQKEKCVISVFDWEVKKKLVKKSLKVTLEYIANIHGYLQTPDSFYFP